MNSIINILIASAVMTIAIANSIGRVSPLPPGPGPVNPPPPPSPVESPSISVNLSANFLLTTLGITGEATANQEISEGVVGSSDVPATLVSSSSNSALLEISGTSDEIAIVSVPDEAVATLNAVNTELIAEGSEDIEAALNGINATVEYSGESAVPLGGGVSIIDANTEVEVISVDRK